MVPSRLPTTRVGVAALAVAALATSVYAVQAVVASGLTPQLRTDLPFLLACGAAWVAVVCRAITAERQRLTWTALGVALLCWGVGAALWALVVRGPDPPFPSVSDAAYLCFYPAAFVAVAALMAGGLRQVPPSTWLDGLTGSLVVGAGAALALPTITGELGGERAAVATTLAYPLGDLVLLSLCVFAVLVAGGRLPPAWRLLILGFAIFAVADTVFLYRVGSESYVENTVLDAGWVLGLTLIAAAAYVDSGEGDGRRAVASAPLVAVVAALAAVALLTYAAFADVGAVSAVLAALAVACAVARLLVTLREVRGLADARTMALTDDLTGLGNRRGFYLTADSALDPEEPRAADLALLLLDLDRFKELNDTLGHQAGDALLVELARRLRALLPPDATLARLGGDEFVALVRSEDPVGTAEAVREAVRQPFVVQGVRTHIGGSVGVAVAGRHGRTRTELLRHADMAMYRAKQRGTGVEVFSPGNAAEAEGRRALAEDLRRGLAREELVLHFQPQVDLESGRVEAVEALVRWQHPTRGLLAPGVFVDLAEQQGLMRPLTLAVLERAARAWPSMQDVAPGVVVAVNVSAANLLDARFVEDVADVLDRFGLAPTALRLEVTENAVVADPQRAAWVLARLGERGVQTSLDDFGTGTSSMRHLKELPVQELKIDRSFVQELEHDGPDAAIVRSTVDLARRLDLRVVAEGVETPEQLERLRAMRCPAAQGYLLGRPEPLEAVLGRLAEVNRGTLAGLGRS